jgi:hypothetical protein
MIGHEPVNLQVKPTTLYSSPTGPIRTRVIVKVAS